MPNYSAKYWTVYPGTFVSHCSVSPTHAVAHEAMLALNSQLAERGVAAFANFGEIEVRFRKSFGKLLRTSPDNTAFVTSTTQAMNFIANNYPFGPDDRILTYCREFPSNYLPWAAAARRHHIALDKLPDCDPLGTLDPVRPRAWSFADIERLVTPRTRIIAISHVQYTSGYAADLKLLGEFCKARGIDLIIDAAQSIGCMPIYPEEYNIAAVAGSGWKWLMAPHGAGFCYTSEEFRSKLQHHNVGWLSMKQGLNFLDLSWNPVSDSRLIEQTTPPACLLDAMGKLVDEVYAPNSMEEIRDRIFALQDTLLRSLDPAKFTPVRWSGSARSCLLAVVTAKPVQQVIDAAAAHSLTLTERGGYLRLAPHCYHTEAQMLDVAAVLNAV